MILLVGFMIKSGTKHVVVVRLPLLGTGENIAQVCVKSTRRSSTLVRYGHYQVLS